MYDRHTLVDQDPAGFGLQLFDLASRSWLPEREATPAGTGGFPRLSEHTPPRFAHNESTGAAIIEHLDEDADGLVIFSTQEPSVTLYKRTEVRDVQWLPWGNSGGYTLLVLGSSELVKLELTAGLSIGPSSQAAAAGGRLAVVPGGCSAVVVCTTPAGPDARLTFTLHDTSSLAVTSTWERATNYRETGYDVWQAESRGGLAPVLCSKRAVIVRLGSVALLFTYTGNRFATLHNLRSDVSFSADGLFLCGLSENVGVCIWCARTGSLLVKLPDMPGSEETLSVAWAGWDKLHIGSMGRRAGPARHGWLWQQVSDEEVVFKVIKFQ